MVATLMLKCLLPRPSPRCTTCPASRSRPCQCLPNIHQCTICCLLAFIENWGVIYRPQLINLSQHSCELWKHQFPVRCKASLGRSELVPSWEMNFPKCTFAYAGLSRVILFNRGKGNGKFMIARFACWGATTRRVDRPGGSNSHRFAPGARTRRSS